MTEQDLEQSLRITGDRPDRWHIQSDAQLKVVPACSCVCSCSAVHTRVVFTRPTVETPRRPTLKSGLTLQLISELPLPVLRPWAHVSSDALAPGQAALQACGG